MNSIAPTRKISHCHFTVRVNVLSNGHIPLPGSVRRKLGLRPGQFLDVRVEGGRITLTPRRTPSRKARILIDPVTRLPVLSAGPDAPVLTSEEVDKILFGE
jgi:AbrB family looped-hinge helix DNA binding protein